MDSRRSKLRSSRYVGATVLPEKNSSVKNPWFLSFFVLVGVFSVFGLAGFITHFVDKSSVVRTISGVPPIGGEITALSDDGIEIVPNVGTNSFTYKNELVRDSRLSAGDSQAPAMWYFHNTGGVAAENVWFMGNGGTTFYPFFMPGINPGQNGQGNVGGTSWVVPAVGYYSVAATCITQILPNTPGDYISFQISMSMHATGTDPNSGQRPSGADQSIVLSSGTPVVVFNQVSTTANFHAGCPGCIFSVGDRLTLHFLTTHFGVGPPVSTEVFCTLEVARHK